MCWTVDGMKKWMKYNSLITRSNQPKLFRQQVHGLVQLLMQNIYCVTTE